MKLTLTLLISIFISSISYAQLNMEWDANFGGQDIDVAHSAIQTPDGGYIVVGSTKSEGSGGFDGYILKIDSKGNIDWNQTYGGKKDDEFFAITKTGNNYAICGYSESKGSGKKDYWLMVVDNEGNKLWEHFYGGKKDDEANDIFTSFDNKVIMTGYTKSKGAGGRDFWIVKVNPNGVGKAQGKVIWQRNIGGKGTDIATKAKQSPIDSFIYVVGHTTSFGAGGMDLYFTRLSPDRGSARGKKYYGKTNFEHGNDFCFTEKNGFFLIGATMSDSKGYFDGWVIKIEGELYKEWEKTYGGLKNEEFVSGFIDGKDYVVGGFTESIGEGGYDAWIVKIDNKGKKLRERTFGEEGNDKIYKMIQTEDGGYLMVGETDSKGEGKTDVWIVKVK